MSGSPKFSSVSYSRARQHEQERERRERERTHHREAQERRRRAELLVSEQATRSAGMLAELDVEMAYLHRGVAFAPAVAAELAVTNEQILKARSLHRQKRFAEAEAACAQIKSRTAAILEVVEAQAQQLALRLLTLEALSSGLRTRGYEVGEALTQSDGTIALRAHLAGRAGLDVALVHTAGNDEIVWQRHDVDTQEDESIGCQSIADLHHELRTEMTSSGIDLGSLRWKGHSPEIEDQQPLMRHREDRR
jgi:hypothetical protein